MQYFEVLIVTNQGQSVPSSTDSRLRVVSHPDTTALHVLRNLGASKATAPLLFFLDSGDLLESGTLEKSLWWLWSHPEDSWVGGYTVGFGEDKYLWQRGFEEREGFVDENPVFTSVLVRKSVFQTVGGFDATVVHGCEEWLFWLKSANSGFWGSTMHEFTLWRRTRRPGAISALSECGVDKRRLLAHFPRLLTWPQPKRVDFDHQNMILLPTRNNLQKTPRGVLVLVPWVRVGGADKYLLQALRGLHKRGFSFTIVCTYPISVDQRSEADVLGLTSDFFILERFLAPRDHVRFLIYILQSRQHELVLIQDSELAYRSLPLLRSLSPGVTFVDINHMEEPEWHAGGFPRYSVALKGLLDAQVSVSAHLRRWMIHRGAARKQLAVCYYGIDHSKVITKSEKAIARQAILREFNLPKNHPIVVYLARFTPQKQPLLMIRVLHALVLRDISFSAILVGDGPDLPAVSHYVTEHALSPRIHVLGVLSEQRTQRLLAGADILFLPSRNEGIPLVLFEAISNGVYVVSSDIGGQREIFGDSCTRVTACEWGVLVGEHQTSEVSAYVKVLTAILQDTGAMTRVLNSTTNFARSLLSREDMTSCLENVFVAARAHHHHTGVLISPAFMEEAAWQIYRATEDYIQLENLWKATQEKKSELSALSKKHATLQKSADEVWFAYQDVKASLAQQEARLQQALRVCSPSLGDKRIFYLRGHGKSGTNWIGRLLNLHPKVHVRGEFNLMPISRAVFESATYGSIPSFPEMQRYLLDGWAKVYETIVTADTKSEPLKQTAEWVGDRSPEQVSYLPVPGPVLFIVRDARDVIVSWIYHLLRVCTLNVEPCPIRWWRLSAAQRLVWSEKLALWQRNSSLFPPEQLITENDQELVSSMLQSWVDHWSAYKIFKDANEDIPTLMIRYEDMHAKLDQVLVTCFRFLRLSSVAELPSELLPLNRTKQRLESFERKGTVGDWKRHRSSHFSKWVLDLAAPTLKELGYA